MTGKSSERCTTPSTALEDVIVTAELDRRSSRPPDYEAENRALVALARHLADSPRTLLSKLAEMALELCHAGSAGISIEEGGGQEALFRWRATTGRLTSCLGGTMPRHGSPCGEAVDRGSTLLMRDPGRYYTFINDLEIPLREVLLVPFFLHGQPAGTVWVVSHDKADAFDAEDARLVGSLAQFAAAASESMANLAESEKTQARLRDVGTQLDAALKAGAIATWSWDVVHDRVFADNQFARLFAVSQENAEGGPIAAYLEAIHPDDRPHVRELIAKSLQDGSVFECEYRVRSPGGDRWVIARGKPLLDSAGKPLFFPGVVVDITERKLVQLDKEEQQHALWAALPVACYSLDAEGRINFYNEAAAALWGRRPRLHEEKWGGSETVLNLDGSPVRREEGPSAVALRERRSVRGVELHIVRPDGSQRWIRPHPDPILDSTGACIGVVNVMFDVTEERLANAALTQARDQALAASRAKDDFLAALSHELRTPLNPALLLASDAAANPAYPAEVRRDFESISRSIELEARLIDDLLDLTRISRGVLKLESTAVELHEVVREAAQKVRSDAEARGITLHWDLAATHTRVKGDPVRLQQVFWNVLKNAVKFTPPQGSVYIRSTSDDAAGTVSVHIRDTGIGMDAEELARIFDAFVQGRHADQGGTHLFGGLGLGLAISEKVMLLHHGRIIASSEGPQKGSSFEVQMPLLRAVESAARRDNGGTVMEPPEAGTTGKTAGLRLLIVEDNDGTREALQRLLARRGHRVSVAATAGEACELATSRNFDLAICDVGLPDMDGYTLVGELHRLQPGLPAVAMTGYGSDADIARSGRSGFLEHLTKPVSVSQLDEVIASIYEV